MEYLNNVSIKPAAQNKLFDHKAIILDFERKKRIIAPPTISKFILKDPELEILIALTVIESYVHSTATMDQDRKNVLLRRIGISKNNFRNCGPANIHINNGSRSVEDDLSRERILGGVRAFIDSVPLQQLQEGPFVDEAADDYFLEGLLNNIRNETISHQTYIGNLVKQERKKLLEKIKNLKKDYLANESEIFALEDELSKKVEDDARTELENHENFEYLNNEKITPYYVSLSKGSKSEAEMEDIRDSDRKIFANSVDRKNFFVNFYAKLYKKPEDDPEDVTGCIENFLGQEICENKIVRNSKYLED
jgi:regulator of replication initiation timing